MGQNTDSESISTASYRRQGGSSNSSQSGQSNGLLRSVMLVALISRTMRWRMVYGDFISKFRS